MTESRRVVVTGGAGFIGVHTVEALLGAGCAVLVIDDFSHASDRELPSACELGVHDVCSEQARDAVIAFGPATVLHLAAQGGVNRSWRDPAADARINVQGTVSMLEAARSGGCARVVIASSGGALYGAAASLPAAEDTRAQPRSPYGAAKWAAEQYLGYFARTGAFTAVALRYGNVYGPGQDGTGEAGVVAITSVRLARGLTPVVRGDGEQTRDFVHVHDVARANVAAVLGDATGALNIGTGRDTSVTRVVSALCAAAGFTGAPEHADLPQGEVRRSCLDVTRAWSLLRWEASVALETGL
ncbi:MAG: NAD-dependent epimerase/dehydratase family protein, partial [Candidatus Dormibacteria bacterium]